MKNPKNACVQERMIIFVDFVGQDHYITVRSSRIDCVLFAANIVRRVIDTHDAMSEHSVVFEEDMVEVGIIYLGDGIIRVGSKGTCRA